MAEWVMVINKQVVDGRKIYPSVRTDIKEEISEDDRDCGRNIIYKKKE